VLPPDPRDLVHDLRNVMGVVRAMALDLRTVLAVEPENAQSALDEIDRHSLYAIEALRVVEFANSDSPQPIHLGAWAWALRLWVRALAVDDLAAAPKVSMRLQPALDAGVAMLRAMHPTRPVSVRCDDASLVFETSTSAVDESALRAAMEALARAGLRAEKMPGAVCAVRVG
jgi:hypothetical protein